MTHTTGASPEAAASVSLCGILLGLLVGAVLLVSAPAGAAEQKTDTVRIDPGDHAAVEVDFQDGPSSDVAYDVQVNEGPNIDVMVMNNANYQAYQSGDDFEYASGWSDLDTGNTQTEFLLEEHGTWWLVLDHTNEPEDGTSPSTLDADSVTANYTVRMETNVEEELRDRWSEIPGPGSLAAVTTASIAAVLASRDR